MCDTKKYPTEPEEADKILFAEDFVNHILLLHNLPLLSSGIAEHRPVIYNAFKPEIRLAANYVYDHSKENISHIFSGYLAQNTIDSDAFNKYAISLIFERVDHKLPNENAFQIWFEFCLKISSMAAKFYQHGFLGAPRLAVDYIIETIAGIAMVEGGWEYLNLLATDYAQYFIDTSNDYMTPQESTSDVDTSSSTSSDWPTTDVLTTDPSSRENSDDSRSPDHEMDGRDDKERHPEKLIEDDLYKRCVTAMSCPSDEPVSSSSVCIPVEKTANEISKNIVSIFDNASDLVSSKLSQKKKSVNPRSPDLEMHGGVDQYELPEKLIDDGFCTTCLAAKSSSSEGPVYSICMCMHVEKTIDVISENVMSLSDNTSDSISSGSPKDKNIETSCHSFEETSSEYDTSKRKIKKKKNMKKSNSYSKNSDSDSHHGEADLKTMDSIDSFTRIFTENIQPL